MRQGLNERLTGNNFNKFLEEMFSTAVVTRGCSKMKSVGVQYRHF